MSEIEYPQGITSGPDAQVCSGHFTDKAVIKFVEENGEWSVCDYCERSRNVVELEQLAEFLIQAVHYFYSDPVGFASYNGREGGFQVESFGTHEIIFDEFGLDVDHEQLDHDLRDWFDGEIDWADERGYYGEGELFYSYPWKMFKEVLKHKSRFKVYEQVIDEYHGEDVTVAGFLSGLRAEIYRLNIFTKLSDKTNIFRARSHYGNVALGKASDFASPPDDRARQPNRMSPSGISMFYGAFDKRTAALEVIEDKGPNHISIGKFWPASDLVVLDLTRMPKVPSQFDEEQREQFFLLNFLEQFAADFSRTIERDGKEHVEYLPTQFMTEYFKDFRVSNKKLDGIIYSSTKNVGGQCLVLFMDHDECLRRLDFDEVVYSREISDEF